MALRGRLARMRSPLFANLPSRLLRSRDSKVLEKDINDDVIPRDAHIEGLREVVNAACFSSILDKSEEDGISFLMRETEGISDISITIRDIPDLALRYLIIDHYDAKQARRVRTLSIRGTRNFKNLRTVVQTRYIYDELLGINIHSGFFSVYEAIREDYVEWACAQENKRVRARVRGSEGSALPLIAPEVMEVTGHSLGGAVACLLSAALRVKGFTVNRVTTFGMPKFTDMIGSMRMLFLLEDIDFERVQHVYDPIGRVPITGPRRDSYAHPSTGRLLLLEPVRQRRRKGRKAQEATVLDEEYDDEYDDDSMDDIDDDDGDDDEEQEDVGDIHDGNGKSMSATQDRNVVARMQRQRPTRDPMTMLRTFNRRDRRGPNKFVLKPHRLLTDEYADKRARKLLRDARKFTLEVHYMYVYRDLLKSIRDGMSEQATL